MTQITLRPMTISDLSQVQKLIIQLGYHNAVEDLRMRFEQLSKLPDEQFIVAADHQEVLGFMHLGRRHYFVAKDWLEVRALVVEEKARGRGVGRLLMEFAERTSLQSGFADVKLISGQQRSAAHSFYESIGYEKFKTSYQFKKEIRS